MQEAQQRLSAAFGHFQQGEGGLKIYIPPAIIHIFLCPQMEPVRRVRRWSSCSRVETFPTIRSRCKSDLSYYLSVLDYRASVIQRRRATTFHVDHVLCDWMLERELGGGISPRGVTFTPERHLTDAALSGISFLSAERL